MSVMPGEPGEQRIPAVPGVRRLAWLLFMQPLRLHRMFMAWGLERDPSLWTLRHRLRDGDPVVRRLVARMGVLLVIGMPLVAIVLVILIVGGIVGGAKAQIAEHAGVLLLATFLLHASGFSLGYVLARVLGLGEVEARTISIEVGMQNSGLGSGLAKTPAFAAQFADITQAALAPVPAAISAVWHVLIGSLLAGWWRRRG